MNDQKRTIQSLMRQEDYRTQMKNLIFAGVLRRPPRGLQYSVYQIMGFEHHTLPIATVSLFDLSPQSNAADRRFDLLTINLKNYKNHEEVKPEKILDIMLHHELDTQHLACRGYLPPRRA